MFKTMDSMCLRFVLMAEGMELNKVDVHKSYNVLHVTFPHRLGGMGLHQLFWAHRARPRAYPCRITTPGAPKILQCAAGPPPLRRRNGSSSGGVLSLSTVRIGYLGCRCAGTDVCSGLNGFGARYDGMGRARHGTIPPPNAPYVPSITVPLSTNASSTACVGKSHFATCGLAPGDRGEIR